MVCRVVGSGVVGSCSAWLSADLMQCRLRQGARLGRALAAAALQCSAFLFLELFLGWVCGLGRWDGSGGSDQRFRAAQFFGGELGVGAWVFVWFVFGVVCGGWLLGWCC